ncbi:MAG TPA: YkgJ family cysteine cluster protein [Actinomycetota bacterium]|nr:YkgJ family cysteine cluster protein [Actinomycetota bacterium]
MGAEATDTRPADNRELERQLERSSMFTQASLQKVVAQITDTRDVLAELVAILRARGILEGADTDEKEEVIEATAPAPDLAPDLAPPDRRPPGQRPSMEEGKVWRWPAIALGVDTDEHSEPVNCAERLHICQAVCCRLTFALTGPEVDAGKVRWDLGFPYHIRHDDHGTCVHNDPDGGGCTVYADRPGVCRRYSCAHDARIWTDFAAMELNHEWIEANLGRGERIRVSGPAAQEQ